MAANALRRVEVDELPFPTLSGNLAALTALAGEGKTLTEQPDGAYAKPKSVLCAAKGAIVAIGLEGAAVFCVYGIWQLSRLIR